MISVIIPALNEETCIEHTLETVLAAKGHFEVIVVDGESKDSTRHIAARYCRTLSSPPGRARQMNRGAEEAQGDLLLFLHADVLFPPSGMLSLERAMADPRVGGGNFTILYEGASAVSRIFTFINRWRRPFGIFYGDSGIFVRRDVFRAMGGYRSFPLMEDYDFGRRLGRVGKTVCLKDPLLVSARRWEEHGLLRTMAVWVLLHVFFYLGIPARLWGRFYPPIRRPSALPTAELDSVKAEAELQDS